VVQTGKTLGATRCSVGSAVCRRGPKRMRSGLEGGEGAGGVQAAGAMCDVRTSAIKTCAGMGDAATAGKARGVAGEGGRWQAAAWDTRLAVVAERERGSSATGDLQCHIGAATTQQQAAGAGEGEMRRCAKGQVDRWTGGQADRQTGRLTQGTASTGSSRRGSRASQSVAVARRAEAPGRGQWVQASKWALRTCGRPALEINSGLVLGSGGARGNWESGAILGRNQRAFLTTGVSRPLRESAVQGVGSRARGCAVLCAVTGSGEQTDRRTDGGWMDRERQCRARGEEQRRARWSGAQESDAIHGAPLLLCSSLRCLQKAGDAAPTRLDSAYLWAWGRARWPAA
jgi:hypothetical protein